MLQQQAQPLVSRLQAADNKQAKERLEKLLEQLGQVRPEISLVSKIIRSS